VFSCVSLQGCLIEKGFCNVNSVSCILLIQSLRIYIHIYVYIYTHTYIYTCIRMFMYVYVFTCIGTPRLFLMSFLWSYRKARCIVDPQLGSFCGTFCGAKDWGAQPRKMPRRTPQNKWSCCFSTNRFSTPKLRLPYSSQLRVLLPGHIMIETSLITSK